MTVHAFPCPTCSGPTRVTVGMVCQTCGTDYAPGDHDQQQAAEVRAAMREAGSAQGQHDLLAAALAAARADEAARHDRLVADLRGLVESLDPRDGYESAMPDALAHDRRHVAVRLRAVLDADRDRAAALRAEP